MEKFSATRSLRVYGYVLGLICIAGTIIFGATRAIENLWFGYLGNCVMFLGVLFSILHYNRLHGDRVNAKASFSMGLRTTILATIIYVAFLLIFYLAAGRNLNNALQEDNKDSGAFWAFFFGNALFVNLFVGVCAALLGAFAFKRNQKTDAVKEQ